ncbi:MAG: type II toxin-antitoxin system RelE/ParE family toxin [Clostridioides difficile]|uniref:type II toxin-antitoxin system RelE/ParE family toxin n=1 Tax=Clostridium sp. TaxID=1506 RepID=UPI001D8D25EF|nr:type II toxin-antitoxin system RelE/ParE family toxin [Clostridium sp.]MBS5308410.1 type II toxin-antitoxin system RelE/ParE family toxin [Clostridium sp.]
MNVYHYETDGGKDLILEYLNKLPKDERLTAKKILEKLEKDGLEALEVLNTRPLRKKLWEIKFKQNRLMYVLADANNIYILHACKKQKGKAEKFELDKAIKRATELGMELGKSFV